jgi:3-deoxy-D-manno-octulosonate 8-phosphate phosphatase (KDO 8-P phosphatase)
MNELIEKLKLIVSEVDGVITEGLVTYDELCNTPFKQYCVKDFEAINELRQEFVFVFISADNSVSFNLFRKKNIPFYWANKSKKDMLVKVLNRYNFSPEEVMYIGSTYSDLDCIKMIPFSLCPEDAVIDVKNASRYHLNSISGMGVMSEVYDLLKPEIIRRKKCS